MRVYVTGAAGFIGYHIAQRLLASDIEVHGIDSMSQYYDVQLKQDRLSRLVEHPGFSFTELDIRDAEVLKRDIGNAKPDALYHLAAQAGVRYSLEAPATYISTNLVGTANLLEALRSSPVEHLLFASTSSVYGGNTVIPFSETHTTDAPQSLYAATKRGSEALLHSYSHLFQIPTTVFRFFTVYGPWGRPDMALFKFVKAALSGLPVDVYGDGLPSRDFTYIDDLVRSATDLLRIAPVQNMPVSDHDTLSPVAPFRIVNIAGGNGVRLTDFISAIEAKTGVTLTKNLLPMQPGDVMVTEASPTLLRELTGQIPATDITNGVGAFVEWYREYYGL